MEDKKGKQNRMTLLYTLQYFLENTYEEDYNLEGQNDNKQRIHYKKCKDVQAYLEQRGFSVDRRVVYDHVAALREFGYALGDYGIEISSIKGKGFYVMSRLFELVEVKLLMDAVQASKVIPKEQTDVLCNKLVRLVANEQGEQLLGDDVTIHNPVKHDNDIYYAIDPVYKAMIHNNQITFNYKRWTVDKKPVDKISKNGTIRYQVSPWKLWWDNGNYYLIAWDHSAGKLKHYRVDKMDEVKAVEEDRLGREVVDQIDFAEYVRKIFGMYTDTEYDVTLRCANYLAGVIIDRFGTDVSFDNRTEDTFDITVPVCASPQFYGWVAGIGKGLEIVGPQEVRGAYKAYLEDLLSAY